MKDTKKKLIVNGQEPECEKKNKNDNVVHFERETEESIEGYSFSIVGVMGTYYYRTTSRPL